MVVTKWPIFDYQKENTSEYSDKVPGVLGGNCIGAIESLLPWLVAYTSTFPRASSVYIFVGTIITDNMSEHCQSGGFSPIVTGAICTISSGDITHDYGTLLSHEVDGRSMTTTATLTCSGGIVGSTMVSLSLNDASISLKNDSSLKASLALNGSGTSTSYDIDANSSATLSVVSTLNSNGNISSGMFSGNSVLTMTYD
ncbi:Uncharacterised protein [Serratia quinivorans]|uniref:MrpH family fimbial adhesin n=1 Tax=Serratia TaxID=613 RepID=UPI001F4C1A3E|nr:MULTISPECIES: hypothetical protein [Serratia]ULG13809.1 SefJ [Serratia proteamaculans]ULG13951.1 SefJ [Serratia proteamaculans]ULG14195.1 SefJ [Serratia proteamaculans]ULG14308.1 SefJ [Serratia proteamaculans]ULG14932.1 SefJ [Serratia proteamaculans]